MAVTSDSVTATVGTRNARYRELASAAGFSDRSDRSVVDRPAIDRPLAQAALLEGLGPLLGHRLKRGEIDVDASEDAERLLHAHRSCTARNVLVESALQPVLERFRDAGIEAVALKGAALVERVFRHPGCRGMGDVDLLVRRDDWDAARESIIEAGARPIDDPSRPLTMSLYHEVHAALPGGGVLDLHRSLSAWPLFGVDHESIFAGSSPTEWGALVPSIDHLFVCLAMHAAQDGFYVPFRSLVDGLAVARHEDASADVIADLAAQWKARRATSLWIRSLLPYGLPEAFEGALHRLGGARRADRAHEIPRTKTSGILLHRWKTRWHLARALDGPIRPMAFFAYRGAAFAADFFLRLVPGGRG